MISSLLRDLVAPATTRGVRSWEGLHPSRSAGPRRSVFQATRYESIEPLL
jgi:hypothetical protein